MGKLGEKLSSPEGTVLARLATLAVPFLIAGLGWYFTASAAATNNTLKDLQAQMALVSIQITRMETQMTGDWRTQAAIDAEQNRRIERLERTVGGEPF